MSNASANEQLMLELVNRARLDPAGEAARFGIDLNQGLSAGTITATPKQPLAMNSLLITAARGHSQHMINVDLFAHEGIGDGDPGSRMSGAGYSFTGSWTWGENIAWQGTTGSLSSAQQTAYIIDEHQSLFLSPGHRTNILNGTFREIGIGQIIGQFTQGSTYNASMVTQNFAKTATNFFVLGVAYDDFNSDAFYTVGEARSGIGISLALAGGGLTVNDTNGSAGGYEIGIPSGTYYVTFSGGGLPQSMTVQAAVTQNVKIDVVSGNTIYSSASLTLGTGATRAVLLGVADNSLTGNTTSDVLSGNSGSNALSGGLGNDILTGLGGDDTLNGAGGLDRAVFTTSRSSSTVTKNGGNTWTVSGPGGTDTLTDVERLVFTDQSLSIGEWRTDFSGEGRSDFLWQTDSGQAALWLMNGTQITLGDICGPNPGPSWHVKGSGDFNGDGKSDILWQTDSGQAAIWNMNGTQVAFGDLCGPNPGPTWHAVGVGDFNADGKSDILWQTDSGRAAIWLMNNTSVAFGDLVGPTQSSSWHIKAAGDFNGDGKSDILWQHDNGQAAIWLMNGTQLLYGDIAGPNPGSNWSAKGVADLNGDGKSDILWQTNTGQAAVWLMNGTQVAFGDLVGPNPGTSWHLVGGDDLNGDGSADLIWQTDSGQPAAWLMNGTQLLFGDIVGPNPGTAWHLIAPTG